MDDVVGIAKHWIAIFADAIGVCIALGTRKESSPNPPLLEPVSPVPLTEQIFSEARAAAAISNHPRCVCEFLSMVRRREGTLINNRMVYSLGVRLDAADYSRLWSYLTKEYMPRFEGEAPEQKVVIEERVNHLYGMSEYWTEVSLWVPPSKLK